MSRSRSSVTERALAAAARRLSPAKLASLPTEDDIGTDGASIVSHGGGFVIHTNPFVTHEEVFVTQGECAVRCGASITPRGANSSSHGAAKNSSNGVSAGKITGIPVVSGFLPDRGAEIIREHASPASSPIAITSVDDVQPRRSSPADSSLTSNLTRGASNFGLKSGYVIFRFNGS